MRFVARAAGLGAVLAIVGCSPSGEKAAERPVPAPSAPATEAAAPAATAPAVVSPGLVTLAAVDADGAPLSGDPVRGQKVFQQCATCHSLEAGINRAGPSLNGIIGRPAGQVANFRYSAGNKNSAITWSDQEMFAYLENPRVKVPGTIMAFAGLRDPQQRADVIAYIKTHGGDSTAQ
jgi:cytochrome c